MSITTRKFITNKHVFNSKNVEKGDVFYAIRGANQNGEDFIEEAVNKGATEIIHQAGAKLPKVSDYVKFTEVENPRLELAKNLSAINPAQPQNIGAVTGTNGKTSVAWFFRQICSYAGYNSGFIGTLGCVADGMISPTNLQYTSPSPEVLYGTLNSFALNGITNVCIEASSHGLDQNRLDYVRLKVAALTNITQDHLDYHGDMDSYVQSKLRLFTEIMEKGGVAVLNADSEYFKLFKEGAEKKGLKVLSYGVKGKDAKIKLAKDKDIIVLGNIEINVPDNIYGDFQNYNLACAILMANTLGVSMEDIVKNITSLTTPPGRLEKIVDYKKRAIKVFIDFAHTPNALEEVLKFLKDNMEGGKLYLLFGCGGERDKEKRLKMGEVAKQYVDEIIITDDNPRNEDPSVIRAQIIGGCGGKCTEIADRKEAIKFALNQLDDGDVLLVAGKGHETYQIYNDQCIFCSDREEVLLNAKNLGLI